jgi:hypothetical protein
MALQPTSRLLGDGGVGLNDQAGKAIKELQGLNVSLVTGAAAGTKMDIAAMRAEDTIVGVIASAAGVLVSDTGNTTISSTTASATITMTDLPVADETVTVNGAEYTFVAAPTSRMHVLIGTGEEDTGDNLAATINSYEGRYSEGWNEKAVVASSDGAGVVTVTSVVGGLGNGPVVTDTGTTITISNTDPAAVTATFVSGANTDAIIVNGVTFTIKTTPVSDWVDMEVLGTDTLQAALAASTINTYDERYGSLDVIATSALGVVTIAPRTARKGNIIQLAEDATNTTVSGAFLSGGTNTGGFVSSEDLSTTGADGVIVTWFNKNA